MDVATRLSELAKLPPAERPVVSVYLNTRWTDEEQRERVRIFLKNHLREARNGARSSDDLRAQDEDLDWIEDQGKRLVAGALFPGADGAVMFAGGEGLREVLPIRAPFDDTFIVDVKPHLRPLAGAAEELVPALVVFVDGVHARLLALTEQGPGEEVTLRSEVDGRHAVAGWAAMAQSRYQRHIEAHRDWHYDAVARAVAELTRHQGVKRIVLSGEARAVSIFRDHLPTDVGQRVVGVVAAAGHEPMAIIAERAAEQLSHVDEQTDGETVDRLLDAAAKRGRAVTGLEPTLEAVNRNAVQQLYLLPEFERMGAMCQGCAALQPPAESRRCRYCGAALQPAELGEAMVGRVLASGGSVGLIERHAELDARGGVGAILRYAA